MASGMGTNVMTIHGFDLSHHQDPARWDKSALRDLNAELQETRGHRLFWCVRASYGAKTADRQFARHVELGREIGATVGVYHFYRQVHSVEDQLTLFNKQLELVGGIQPGDAFPCLDMEDNRVNGDGRPNKKIWNDACDKIGDAWKSLYGGCILYYSAYFPDQLDAHKGDVDWKWMQEPGYKHWLADYSVPDGAPRHPYTPAWHAHQPKPRTTPYYKGAVVDVDIIKGELASELVIPGSLPDSPIDPAAPEPWLEHERIHNGLELLRDGITRCDEAAKLIEASLGDGKGI